MVIFCTDLKWNAGLDVSVYSVLFPESRYEPYILLADQRYQKLMYISFLSQLVVIPVQ